MRRRILRGQRYTLDEEERGETELEEVPEHQRYPEPPEEIQGEPWGWTKPGSKPRGWREDNRYGPD